jgi:hypothetical protein
MDHHGNGYAGYNRQTVVVGIFYIVLQKLREERDLPEIENSRDYYRLFKIHHVTKQPEQSAVEELCVRHSVQLRSRQSKRIQVAAE